MSGSGRIKKALGGVRRRIQPGGVVLVYHRVTELAHDTYRFAVPPVHFAEHMEVLRRGCLPMHLTDMIKAAASGRLPNRAIAVTFDDGYCDTFTEAYPLLQAVEVPATVFVVSGHVDSGQEFWWDELERVILAPDYVPPRLRFLLQGRDYCWPTLTGEDRILTHRRLHRITGRLAMEQREELLYKLAAWACVSPVGRPAYRALHSDELAELIHGDLVRIGGHTVSHPVLSALDTGKQRREIVEGCRRLEEISGRRIEVFAYPYGGASDWTEATAGIVRDAGLKGAVTTLPGFVKAGANPFGLGRWVVGNWDGDQFARALESSFGRGPSVRAEA